MKRARPYVWLLAFGIAVFGSPAHADIGQWVHFTGLDRVHLKIDVLSSSLSTVEEIGPLGSNILWQGTGPTTVLVFRAGLAPGSYLYRLNYEFEKGACVIPAAFKGTPLQDEIYGDQQISTALAEPGVLHIPAGRSIGLHNVSLPDSSFLSVTGAGAFAAAGSRFGGAQITGAGDFSFTRSVFRGGVQARGASSGTTFLENTFYGEVLSDNSAALFENNVFCAPLVVHSSGQRPTVRDNSFVGRRGLIGILDQWGHTPIPIGPNFYGDATGPIRRGDPEFDLQRSVSTVLDWVLMRGGATVEEYFQFVADSQLLAANTALSLGGAKVSGAFREDKSVFPYIWCAGVAMYQQAVSSRTPDPLLRQGRPFMISVDLRGWDKAIQGAAVYALVDGVRYDADNKPIHRNLKDAPGGFAGVRSGQATFNIEVPGQNHTSVHVRVFMDTTGVQGYDGSGAVTELANGDVALLPAFARRLRIMIAPWEIRCPGYSTATPSVGGAYAELARRIATMLPLNSNEVDIQQEGPGRYYAGYGALLEIFSPRVVALRLALDLKLFLNAHNDLMPPERKVDRLIVVVPHGVLGSATNSAGLGVVFRRIDGRIAILEESASDAVIHELIHTLGYDREQYEDYPPDGIRIQDMLAYEPSGGIDGFSVRAWPAWAGGTPYWDVMGRSGNQWIIPHTWFVAYSGLRDILGAAGGVSGSSVQKSKPAARSGDPTISSGGSPTRTVLLRGSVLGDTQLVASTIVGFDRSGLSSNVWRGEPRYDNNGYNFQAYDAANQLLTNYPFVAEGPWFGTGLGTGDFERAYCRADGAPWQRYFDYPTNAHRLLIAGAAYNPGTYWQVTRNTNFACAIATPASDTALNGVTQIAWTISGAGSAPVMSEIAWSTNAAQWNPIGDLTRATEATLTPKGLPISTSIAIRVRISDGFNVATAHIYRLRVGNQPPSVRIRRPVEGDRAATGVIWRLVGEVDDPEEGALSNGVWTSSRDGLLAHGLSAQVVGLSTGEHWIAFTATDSGGMSASARVAVAVGALSNVDLRVGADALDVAPPGVDPVGVLDPFFEPGRSNLLSVLFRNAGVPSNSTASARLWIQPPGGSETLIVSQALDWAAFDEAALSHTVVPTTTGVYRIRAELNAVSPPDTNAVNNMRTWDVPSGLGRLYVHLDPPAAVSNGARWRLAGGAWQTSGTTLSNLLAGTYSIEFASATGFVTPPARMVDVASGRRAYFARLYQPGGQLRVTISPSNAVAEGAQWQVNGGAWQESGATVSGLATGFAVVTYRDLDWWQTPPAQTVTVRIAELTTTNGVYVELPRPPPKPTAVSPTNGQRDVAADFVFLSWQADASKYTSFRVALATTPVFAAQHDLGPVSYVTDLEYDRVYFWRVTLSNAIGVTTGDTWQFTTEKPPPIIISPRMVTGVVGHVLNYRIEAANATGWGAESLPTWLTNLNGTLRGICPSATVEFVTLYASNAITYRTYMLTVVVEAGAAMNWAPSASGVIVDLHGVTYGNGQFIVVGDLGTILTSPDAATWTARASGVTNHLRDVVWGPQGYVAVGFEGAVVRSTNGIAWARQTSGIARSIPLLGVGYGFGKYVAVGYEKWILNSANGSNWTERSFVGGSINPLADVALTNNAMIAAGGITFGFPTYMRSTNADAWSNVAAPGADGLHDIVAGKGIFVAVGRNGAVHVSTNGAAWTIRSAPYNRDLFGVCNADDQFVAVGWTGSVWTSSNAERWRLVPTGAAEDLYAVTHGNGRLVAVGRFGRILVAPYVADRDGDTFADATEYAIGTDPLNPDSYLGFAGATFNAASGIVIRWQSVSGRVYAVHGATNLVAPVFSLLAPAVTGRSEFTTWTNAAPASAGLRFYRIHTTY